MPQIENVHGAGAIDNLALSVINFWDGAEGDIKDRNVDDKPFTVRQKQIAIVFNICNCILKFGSTYCYFTLWFKW